YERNSNVLLEHMAEEGVAEEINFASNDFILDVSGREHPFGLYHQAGVPLVLGTDDAGILRTDLTQQFVMLAKAYPEITYSEIKTLVYNSITYSFLSAQEKQQGIQALKIRFAAFEEEVTGWKY
ncbi:MAG: adenosine deaminase, partial [Bacteroidota bacterium]